MRDRAVNLGRIAVAYSRVELEQEKGIGPVRAVEGETWLSGQGLSLRVERDCSSPAVAVSAAGSGDSVASSDSP